MFDWLADGLTNGIFEYLSVCPSVCQFDNIPIAFTTLGVNTSVQLYAAFLGSGNERGLHTFIGHMRVVSPCMNICDNSYEFSGTFI